MIVALFAAASGFEGKGKDGQGTASDLWPVFLDKIATLLGAEGICLQVVDEGRLSQSWQRGSAMGMPDITALNRMRSERVYSHADLPGSERLGPDQFLRTLRWATGPDSFAVLVLQRQGRDFRATHAAQLSRLAPYLGPAMAGWLALGRERSCAALERRMTQGLGAFWLLLSASGRVIDTAPGLQERLATVPALRLQPDGWLTFADAATAQAFRRALAEMQTKPEAVPVVDLSREPPAQMVFLPDRMARTGELIALMRLGPRVRTLPVNLMVRHFNMTRSEAHLAMLLCDGFTLRAAAEELGWTIETARSCSKQIFSRIGVNGQSGILRKVFVSAVLLGSDVRGGRIVR